MYSIRVTFLPSCVNGFDPTKAGSIPAHAIGTNSTTNTNKPSTEKEKNYG